MALLDFRIPVGADATSTSLCANASHLLLVDVQSARNLKNIVMLGTIDPFVALFTVSRGVETQIGRTSVKPECLNPEWNESFLCTIPRDVTVLRARVMGGSSKLIGTLDFDLASNSQSSDSTVGWFPLESQRGEVRIGWRTISLQEMLRMPAQMNDLQAHHAAEVRRLEITAAEAEGRAQAADKRAEALQSDGVNGFNALQAIAADHSHAQEENASLTLQLVHKDNEIAQLRRELEEQKQSTMTAKARRAFAQVSETVAEHMDKAADAYESQKQAFITGAAQAKELASSGVGIVKGMFSAKQTSPTSASPKADV